MIKRILNWFQAAKPQPTAKDVMTQIGCHFEEVAEMGKAVCNIDLFYNVLPQAKFWKSFNGLRSQEVIKHFNNVALLDALCDQIVTAVGVAYMMGYDIEGALAEVCRSNESKFEDGKPVFDSNGKIAKSKNYTAPDLARFIRDKE